MRGWNRNRRNAHDKGAGIKSRPLCPDCFLYSRKANNDSVAILYPDKTSLIHPLMSIIIVGSVQDFDQDLKVEIRKT